MVVPYRRLGALDCRFVIHAFKFDGTNQAALFIQNVQTILRHRFPPVLRNVPRVSASRDSRYRVEILLREQPQLSPGAIYACPNQVSLPDQGTAR